jgi:hypothetical protein
VIDDGLLALLDLGPRAGAHLQARVAGDVPVVGDDNGDGRADVAVFRPSTSGWYVNVAGFTPVIYGQAGDLPVPADYDGDGKTDLAVFRPATGTWYVQRSTLGAYQLQYGVFGDVPVPADYDGNGTADIAVYRPWSGNWWIEGQPGVTWGIGTQGDVPLPADYDGDGLEDVAVFRRNSGIWYLSQSGAGVRTLAWGDQLQDFPTPGEFDASSLGTEVAVYRPTGGLWYVKTTSSYYIITLGGQAGDIPALRRK